MPVVWKLKKWLAVEHDIYRPSELQALLVEKAGVQLSLQAVSTLLNGTPGALRLRTVQALCNALNCTLSDFCEVLPDNPELHNVSEDSQAQMLETQAENPPAISEKVGSEIDPATRAIILRILEEQGLVPRTSPQPLMVHRRLLGMLIPTWVWPLIPDLTRGIVEMLASTPYDLVLYSVNEEDLEAERSEVIDQLLATQLTAGLLAIFPGRACQYLTRLSRQGFPVVIIDDQDVQTTPWVGADNTAGAYSAVRHLIELGHRRIAHIKGPSAYLVSSDRYRGYCQALLEAGITPDPALVLEGDFLPPSGHACASKLFELPLEKRPTAIFASSDQMAYGVLTAAEAYGLSVPRDIAVVGFDDDAPSVHIHPALTTVRQPYFEMGQQGIKLLLSLLDTSSVPSGSGVISTDIQGIAHGEGGAARSLRVQLPTRLIVRESCGADYHSSIPLSSGNPAL